MPSATGNPAAIRLLTSAEDAALITEFCVQADVTEATRIKYRAHLAEFSRWLQHPQTIATDGSGLAHATRANVARYMAYLLIGDRYAASEYGKPRTTLAASSRKSVLGSLHAFYRYLVYVELAPHNPADGLPRPTQKQRRGLHLTADELRRLLDVRGSARDRVQVYLLAYTAARVGEIRNLRWQDVDLAERTLALRTKGDRQRVIDIHPRLMSELRRWFLYVDHMAERNPDFRAAMADPLHDYVLLTRSGRQLSPTTIYKQLKRRAVHAGLYELEPGHREHRSLVSPHTLRRTFATLLLNDGHHLDAVADVLGHESVDTTRKHYAFSSNARRRATIEAFNV